MNAILMSYIFIGLMLTASSVLILLCFAPVLGLIDHPCVRKCHDNSTPVVGGLAMFSAMACSLLFIDNVTDDFFKIITLSSFLVIIGALDDRFPIRASVRLVLQIILTVVLIEWTGYKLDDLGALLGQDVLVLGMLAIPMTVLGVVGTINAVNFSDGADGLAGSLVMVAFVYLYVLAWSSDSVFLLNEFAVIIGVLLAFLLFNARYFRKLWGRSRAKIFMGDAGSMLLGFLLAWYFISLSQGEVKLIEPVTALWLFAMPLLDTVAIMLRRILHGRSPFSPDREHLHHIFLHAGFSTCKTVVLLTFVAIILGGIGVLGQILKVPEVVMFGSFLALFALYFFAMMHAWKLMKMLRKL